LTLLQKAQKKARQDQIFGGLSKAERAEFDKRAERIHILENSSETGG
jgi:hypothetical protein